MRIVSETEFLEHYHGKIPAQDLDGFCSDWFEVRYSPDNSFDITEEDCRTIAKTRVIVTGRERGANLIVDLAYDRKEGGAYIDLPINRARGYFFKAARLVELVGEDVPISVYTQNDLDRLNVETIWLERICLEITREVDDVFQSHEVRTSDSYIAGGLTLPPRLVDPVRAYLKFEAENGLIKKGTELAGDFLVIGPTQIRIEDEIYHATIEGDVHCVRPYSTRE